MGRRLWAGAAIAVAVGLYLGFWPVPVEPVAWQPPPNPGYAGPHAVNASLRGLSLVDLGGAEGPEHVARGPDGRLYMTVLGGDILRLDPDADRAERWVNTGGRVLGFAFDGAGNLIAADAVRGLLSIDAQGRVRVIADRVTGAGGDPIRYANSVTVAADGTVYLTDASGRFAPKDWGGTFEASILDILEHTATGRVLAIDPATGEGRVVFKDLSFANGIALSADGRSLFVNETGGYRVWKVDADAVEVSARSPGDKARVLLDALPGYPDNLLRGEGGRIWLGLAKPRSPVIDRMAGSPGLRALTLRLPRALWPVPRAYGHVIAFTEEGEVVADLQDPTGAYPETTGVAEVGTRLYIMSLHAPALGWMPKAAAGLR